MSNVIPFPRCKKAIARELPAARTYSHLDSTWRIQDMAEQFAARKWERVMIFGVAKVRRRALSDGTIVGGRGLVMLASGMTPDQAKALLKDALVRVRKGKGNSLLSYRGS